MLSYIYRVIQDFEKQHSIQPNLLYLNNVHFEHLKASFSESFTLQNIIDILQVELIIDQDAIHPHVAWSHIAQNNIASWAGLYNQHIDRGRSMPLSAAWTYYPSITINELTVLLTYWFQLTQFTWNTCPEYNSNTELSMALQIYDLSYCLILAKFTG